MANMSYCRFENTYHDLKDCYEALNEAGSLESLEQTVNEYEKKFIQKLVELCKDITDEFGDELYEDSNDD